MKSHTLFFSKIRKAVAKFVVCCSRGALRVKSAFKQTCHCSNKCAQLHSRVTGPTGWSEPTSSSNCACVWAAKAMTRLCKRTDPSKSWVLADAQSTKIVCGVCVRASVPVRARACD